MRDKKEDPFKPEYERQNSNSNQWKYDNLPDIPILVDIELTNYCNMACKICVQSNGEMKRKKGFMAEETYFKIISELSEYKTPIRLIGWGEPLMHHSFWKFVKIAKDAGLRVHANTNGVMLRQIKAPIDSLKISIHENYPRVIRGLESLYTANCFKHVSITYDELEETSQDHDWDFDDMPVDKVSKYAAFSKDKKFHKRLPNCPEMEKLTIHWNGDVVMCCADFNGETILGNVMDDSLKNIWGSEKAEKIRKIIVSGKHFKTFDICANCWDLNDY